MKKFIGSKSSVVSICAVLVAVSAFFYVPMDVRAEELIGSGHFGSPDFAQQNTRYTNAIQCNFGYVDILSDAVDDKVYEVVMNLNLGISANESFYWSNIGLRYGDIVLFLANGADVFAYSSSHSCVRNVKIYLSGEQIKNQSFSLSSRCIMDNVIYEFIFDAVLDYEIVSVSELSSNDAQSYQNGYNAGYSVGEQAGYGNGYSNGFADGEASVDTDAIYDEAFQAGKDSVDIESYYDAGYNAGYSSGKAQGYEEGYNKGYDDAMERIKSFGFDSTSYPIHVVTVSDSNTHTSAYPKYGQITDLVYTPYSFNFTSSDINPKNVYCFSGMIDKAILYANGYSNFTDAEIFLDVGGLEYSICTMPSADTFYSPGFKVFIPGNRMASVATIKVKVYGAVGNDEQVEPYINLLTNSCTMFLQDYGPLNVSQQNAIANQTDILEGTLEEQKEIQQGQLEEQKEQTETQKGIAASIKEFFGSFFDNLINSIIHVIVPTKEEMGELFNRLNDFFSETFGFLYYPFEFIINAFNIFLVADSGTGLTLPAFSIMGYEVWGNQTYDIASEPIVGEIFGFVRMGTGAMIVMWFVNFLKDFFDKRFGGGGN